MKKLIDVAAVNAMKGEGKSIIYIDRDTLVTPAARDAIDTNGMTIKEGCDPAPETTMSASCCQDQGAVQEGKSPKNEVSADLIFHVLSRLQESGLLKGMLDACVSGSKPYDAEYDPAGFKLIRGDSIRTEVLDTGIPAQAGKVHYKEIIGADDKSSIAAGIITIDHVEFGWETECQEIYYIVSGCITVTIDGKVYEARTGDAFFIKKGVQCSFGAKGLGKAFYATY